MAHTTKSECVQDNIMHKIYNDLSLIKIIHLAIDLIQPTALAAWLSSRKLPEYSVSNKLPQMSSSTSELTHCEVQLGNMIMGNMIIS